MGIGNFGFLHRQLVRAPLDRDQPQTAVRDDGDQQRAQRKLEALAAGSTDGVCSVIQANKPEQVPAFK